MTNCGRLTAGLCSFVDLLNEYKGIQQTEGMEKPPKNPNITCLGRNNQV